MATLDTITTRVKLRVMDSSFTDENIRNFINEGLGVISGTVKLPEHDTISEVETDPSAVFVPLPADYQRGLYRAEDVLTGKEVGIALGKGRLAEIYTGLEKTGAVGHVAAVGKSLYYQPNPSEAATVRIYYYRQPTSLVETDDEPTCIPPRFQMRLLESYASWQCFELLEDGIEGGTPNTDRQRTKFYEALQELKLQTREGVSNPKPRTVKTCF